MPRLGILSNINRNKHGNVKNFFCYTVRLALFCAVFSVVACGKTGYGEAATDSVSEVEIAAGEPSVPSESDNAEANSITVERKLIKEGNLSVEVEDFPLTERYIDSAIRRHRAFVASEQTYGSSGRESRSLTIRVPADQFDALVSAIAKGPWRVEQRDIQTQDVTAEFVDVEARLRAKKELENRYLKLLERANKIDEILAIERQIGTLRSDIEATEGRLRYLANRSDYSTLHVSYYKPVPTSMEFGRRFKDNFGSGWGNFVDFFLWLVSGWPFLLLLAAVLFGWRRWRKHRRQRKQSATQLQRPVDIQQ